MTWPAGWQRRCHHILAMEDTRALCGLPSALTKVQVDQVHAGSIHRRTGTVVGVSRDFQFIYILFSHTS